MAQEAQDSKRRAVKQRDEDKSAELRFGNNPEEEEDYLVFAAAMQVMIMMVVRGEIAYITIGENKAGDKLLISAATVGGSKSYAGGRNWKALTRELTSLIEEW